MSPWNQALAKAATEKARPLGMPHPHSLAAVAVRVALDLPTSVPSCLSKDCSQAVSHRGRLQAQGTPFLLPTSPSSLHVDILRQSWLEPTPPGSPQHCLRAWDTHAAAYCFTRHFAGDGFRRPHPPSVMEGTLHAFYLRTTSQVHDLLSVLLAEDATWCGLSTLALAASLAQVHQRGLELTRELPCFPGIYLKACFLVLQGTESEPPMVLVTLQSAFQASPESTSLFAGQSTPSFIQLNLGTI